MYALTSVEKSDSNPVHEFMVMDFVAGIDPERQGSVMATLEAHFGRCGGLKDCQIYRDQGGRWVNHLVWDSQEALDASAGLEDDPLVAELFTCFLTETIAYACCERVEAIGSAKDAEAPVL